VAPTQTINIVPPDPGRVDEGLLESMRVTGTYWQEVHAAVAPSVVAIQARAAGTGSVGSGFILDAAGHIVTNNHVITGAEDNQVQITLSDGRLYRADIIGGDSFTDLAVVKLQNPPSDLQPVALGDSNVVQVGDPVLAVGNPLGLANTATTGIVSAINRPVTATGQDGMPETVTNAIQIDAAINPGNSGGPLFDYQGRVIGVNSSIATLSVGAFGGQQGSIGLGFAIPVNLAKYVSAQLIETGEAKHARLGVTAQPVTVSTGDFSRRGARIASVADGTAAAAAGLQVDDVVIAFNGLTVGGSDSLTAFVRERQIGEVIHLTVVREGQIIELVATLGAMVDTPQIVIPTPELTFPPDYEEGAEAEEGSYPEGQD
jgi:putative serine protease PepD